MATDKEASCPTCSSDPNFAVICSFLNKFAEQCGIAFPSFAELQEMLEDTQEVSQVLIDMHVKLLRKARKSFTADKWERALAKFCHTYSQQDGWELERFGYKKARLGVKVKLLKVLLETQFDVNAKFKTEVNKYPPSDLRLEPLGRDQTGLTYWCQFDPASHVRVYREDVDDETWELVAKDRDGLVQLIDSLSNGEGQRELNNILNEDSTSQEIEKPITDTGQNAEAAENDEEDESEEEASEDEVEDEEEEEADDKKESGESDETKTVERTSSDDSKSADVPQAKLPDGILKKKITENGANGAVPSSDNSENSLSGVDLSLKTEPRKCFSTSQQGNFYMIPDRHPLPETADILSQMSAKFNENKEIEDLSINSKKTKAEELDQSEVSNPPKKVKFIDEPSTLPLSKSEEKNHSKIVERNEAEKNDQPVNFQYCKAEKKDLQNYKVEKSDQPTSLLQCMPEKNDKPTTSQPYKSEKDDQPINLQHYNPEKNDQPISLLRSKPEKNDQPISLQHYKPEKNDQPISLQHYKPEKNDQPISLQHYKPEKNDQPISLQHYKPEKNDQPISLQHYKPEKNDQPISLQHYNPEKNDQPISLQRCKPEKSDQPISLQHYKPEKNDQPISLQHYKPEKNDQPISLQHYKAEKNDQPMSLLHYKPEKNDQPISLKHYKPEKNDQPISLHHYKPEKNLQPISLQHYKHEKSNQSATLQHYKPLEIDQPVMLVKKDVKSTEQFNEPISLVTGNTAESLNEFDDSTESEFSDTMEEPVQYISGPGSGAECDVGNPRYSSSSIRQSADEEAESRTEFSEVIEEPVQYIFGHGSGSDSDIGNHRVSNGLDVREEHFQIIEPEFSDVIEEPLQYVVGLGSGIECDVGNPRRFECTRPPVINRNEIPGTLEPEFSTTIEEPVQFIKGSGSGAECGVGSPRHVKDPSLPSSSYSVATMGIECSMRSLTIQPFEPNFSDVIEDPIMFIQGSGYGHDCLTGNPDEKEDTSVEENAQNKKLKLSSKNIDGITFKEGSENKAGSVSSPLEHFQNSIDSVDCSKNVDSLTEGEASSRLKTSSEISGIEQNIPLNDKLANCEKIETDSINCNNLHNPVNNEQNSLSIKGSYSQRDSNPKDSSIDLTPPTINNAVKNTSTLSNDSSSHSLKYNNISSYKGDVSKPPVDNNHEVIDFSLNKLLTSSGSEETSQHKDFQRMEDNASSSDLVGKSKTNKNSKSNASFGLLDLTSKGEEEKNVMTIDNGNISTTDQSLQTKKRRDSVKTKAAVKNENGPLPQVFENSSVKNLSAKDPANDAQMSEEKDGSNKSTNNETQADKKIAPRKNVMLTNIIEVCLDNNTNSKDNSQLEIPEPTSAKYNDLFSAKDLLNPPSRKNVLNNELKETAKEKEKNVTSSKGEGKIVSSKTVDKSVSSEVEGKTVLSKKEDKKVSSKVQGKTVTSSKVEGETVNSSKEECGSVSSSKEEGKTVSSLKEEGETLSSLKEEEKTVYSSKEDEKSVSSSKQEEKSVSSSKQEEKSVSSSKQEEKSTSSSKDEKSISSSKEEERSLSSSKEEEKSISSSKEEEKSAPPSKEVEQSAPPSKEEEKSAPPSKDNSKTVSSSKEENNIETENDITPANLIKKEGFEDEVKSEDAKDKIQQVEVKEENLNPDESSKTEDILPKKSDSDSEVKIKAETSIKNEEKDVQNDEKHLKQVPRGRKSRTNSLCNEKEVEIPNKIRKTDKIEAKPTRRSTRRSNRSNSQSGLNSVSEDEVKKNENIEEKSSSVQEDLEKDQTTSDNKLIIPEDKDDKKENGSGKKTLSPEDVPKSGPANKNLNRKRRSSMRMSRSEEEGAEIQADEEEAGGKKPRLRGKARRGRGRGTVPASRPPPEASSSEEDNVEKKEDAQKGAVAAGRGQQKGRGPTTRAAQKTKANNIPTAPSAVEPKKKKKGKSKQDEKSEEDCIKEVKKQTPPKKLAKGSKKSKEDIKKKEKSEEPKDDSGPESANKKVKTVQEKKKGKKSSKIPAKQRKTSKDEKQDSDEEDREEDEEDEEEEEEEEADETNLKEKKEVKSKEKKDKMTSSQENLDKHNDEPEPQEEEPKPKKVRTPKKKTLLGLMESDLIHSKRANTDDDDGSRVRQSRRIAQIKIKEEAERRAIEEATMLSIKDMKKTKKEEKQPTSKKSKKKKGRSEMGSEDEDETFKNPVTDDKKLGRKKKKRKDRLKYDENRPWRSSSDSSSEEADEEEEHFDEEDDEEDIRTKQLVSDHEFSPESDLEGEPEDVSTVPVRRARTAKKDPDVAEDAEEAEELDQTEDYPCKKCGQPNHPEWILLCDKCDSGYHASCLRPPLMLIPEGDWFCPPCQHADLVNKLKETLRIFEKSTKKRENEELRRKRLAYVGISLANVLPTTEKTTNRRRISSSEYSSSSEETESSEEEEPVYQLRQRRTALQANYRFNDYDELINSAIQDEMELVKGAGNMGRGKDIANIVEAEKGEAAEPVEEAETQENEPNAEDEEQGENWRPRVVPKNTALPSLRKKPKKLTDLDRASDEDGDSDEDFKGSSEEEEYSSTDGGDSDDSEAKVPIRRSSRNRISRIDKEFINDDSESSDEPRRKKTRKLYASSSSESSDSTWGRRKRKSKSYSRIRSSKGGKKKKKNYFDSDSDRPKKVKSKRPKIKYGLSEDDEDDGGPIRRTRGKKVSYLDIAGSDTEEEVIRRSRKLPSDDEDEFIPEKEGGDEEEAEVEEDEEIKDAGNDEEDEEDEENKNDEKEESGDEGSMEGIDSPHNENCGESFNLSSDDRSTNLEEISNSAVDRNCSMDLVGIDASSPNSDKNLNDSSTNKNLKGPAVVVEPVKTVETLESQKVSEGEDIEEEEEDDDVEEEEVEEEIEEEVEEEEYESEGDEKVEEAKNLAVPKLRIVDTRELIRKEPEIVRKVPPVTITVVKANPSTTVKEPPTHMQPTAPMPPLIPASVTASAPPTSVPTPVIKVEDKKEEKEEKKEPVPAIRLVPSAKLLDPNKQRRVADESVIRGMLSGGGYYRPQRIPQAPPPQYRQRYQEQQRYSMYQPPPPPPSHQYYPTGGYYTNEDYGNYDEHMEQQVVGGGDEDGVFSGLVSYFSSQREDNLDS